jgi:hypothetical protein
MSLNFAGYPVGSAIAGFLAAGSVTTAIVVAVGAQLLGAILVRVLIPARAVEFGPDGATIQPGAASPVGDAGAG